MIKKIVITGISLLIAVLSFSQNSYPKKIVLKNDTIIAITPIQLKKINYQLGRYSFLKEYSHDLEHYIAKQINVNDSQLKINRELNKRNMKLLDENSSLTKLNSNNKKLQEYLKKEIKVQKKQKVWNFFGGLTIGVATTSTLMLLLKK